MATNEPVVFNGRTFRSLRSACEQLNVSRSTVLKRIRAGIPIDEAIDPTFTRRRYTPIIIEGTTFESKKSACEHYNISYTQFLDRIRLGWTVAEALEIAPAKNRNNKNNYRVRIGLFAKKEGTTVKSVESRLHVRRTRFRKWLELPNIDNYAHINARHVFDPKGRWFYSASEAARHHKLRLTTVLHTFEKCDVDYRYGARFKLDSEMVISFETLFLLMSHPKMLERELSSNRPSQIRLDHNVVFDLDIIRKSDGTYITSLTLDGTVIIGVRFTLRSGVTHLRSAFYNAHRGRHVKQSLMWLAYGCCYLDVEEMSNQLTKECNELGVSLFEI